jgi:eukaryotic-like serine/threonine-protein kinase
MIDSQPSAADCPSLKVLVEFGLGELADVDFETVAGHLSQCDTCLAIIADVHGRSTTDILEERVRDCLVASELRKTVTHADAASAPTVSASGTATAPTVGQDPWVGHLVGRYHILKRLGAGGMGVVYLAEDPAVGRAVALKMISAEDIAKANRLERFRAEGRALARVRHPNVVQFFHFDEHAGHPYYTMEFVAGTSLADRLPDNPLPIRDAVELVRTVAVAVQAIHEQGVIHRDIKPSNILIEADGTPKVADFGLAKLADATGQSDRTHTGMVLGTPKYMPPEQAEGRIHDIDARADVYALGAVLYAALTGHPPLKGRSKRDTLRLVAGAIPAPPSRRQPEVPKILDRICAKCLEKDPGRRYSTSQALADDLDDWLAGRAPRSLPGVIGRAMRPTRRQALVAGLGLAATAAGVIIYRRDPDVILRGIQADLRAGKPVTLIGEKGKPKWYKWAVGEAKGKTGVADDGAFTVHAGDEFALVELLPDPQTDSYRLEVNVRHDLADRRTMGEVGLYVARQELHAGDVRADFYIQWSFNDVSRPEDFTPFGAKGKLLPVTELGLAELRPSLIGGTDNQIEFNKDMAGHRLTFNQADVHPRPWRMLEATVTPAGVWATWNGMEAARPLAAVNRAIAFEAAQVWKDPNAHPALRILTPEFVPRGGLGLFVSLGTASFQSVTITPLKKEDPHV